MDELLEQFLIEGPEQVQQASDDLMALERDPYSVAHLDSAFRAVHTLKGSVALFDFAPMGTILHNAEELLQALRQQRLLIDGTVLAALIDCVAACDQWLRYIARAEKLPPSAPAEAQRLSAALLAPVLAQNQRQTPHPDVGWLALLLDRESKRIASIDGQLTAVRFVPREDCFFHHDDPIERLRSIPSLVAVHVEERAPWSRNQYDPYICNMVVTALSAANRDVVRRALDSADLDVQIVDAKENHSPERAELPSQSISRSFRIDERRIDKLVDVVGELIIAKNSAAHLASRAASLDVGLARDLTANGGQIERLVAELHRGVMALRMVPLAQTFRRFPLLVRDIAGRLEKQVNFVIKGDDVEADKAVVDGLFEPLLHMLRNAVDHGIEPASARTLAGKEAVGTIRLEATRQGDMVAIAVADDGPGLNVDRIRQAARERGIAGEMDIDQLDDAAILDLIFAPGFSTASQVTDISGRGVGLDAVRTAVDAIGGRISVASTPGKGTTATLLLPQAVIVTPVLIVMIGNEQFGVPIDAVAETLRIPADRILPVGDGDAIVVRDETIALLRLSSLLEISTQADRQSEVKIVIVFAGGERIGLEVDGFGDRTDVLLRPMSGILKGVPGVLGSALLGDGRVLVILNVAEVVS